MIECLGLQGTIELLGILYWKSEKKTHNGYYMAPGVFDKAMNLLLYISYCTSKDDGMLTAYIF